MLYEHYYFRTLANSEVRGSSPYKTTLTSVTSYKFTNYNFHGQNFTGMTQKLLKLVILLALVCYRERMNISQRNRYTGRSLRGWQVQSFCCPLPRSQDVPSRIDIWQHTSVLTSREAHLCFGVPSFYWRTSLVVQWLRIHLPMQETWVQSLVWEDSTCHRAAKPLHWNCWTCTARAHDL